MDRHLFAYYIFCMALDYTKRLLNTQQRKFDSSLNESLTSKNFSSQEVPDNVKYILEAMRPIGVRYNSQTIQAANNAKAHLEGAYKLHFDRAYRRQGSVETDTNIKAHSDIDLLTIIDRYHYLPPDIKPQNPYRDSDPDEDIKALRKQTVSILKGIYDEVDDSNEKCVSFYNKNLRRKVDIVPGFWYHSEKYAETQNEFYRGVKLGSRLVNPDFPFAHIWNVNKKGENTYDGSRRAIRMLKTLRADSDHKLEFAKSFHLTTIVHSIDNSVLLYYPGLELNIASAVSDKLKQLIDDPSYRRNVQSPNGCEHPLTDEKIVKDLQLLKTDLDEVILDAANEINRGFRVKDLVKSYN